MAMNVLHDQTGFKATVRLSASGAGRHYRADEVYGRRGIY